MPVLEPRAASSRIDPTKDQRTTIIVACVYSVVIVILWNIPILKLILYPFKLLTVGFHEFSHAAVGLCTGAKIESIVLEPNEGGATRMRGGIPWLTLPAGYLGSSIIGAALIACGFDERASKVASIVIGVFFLFTLWWARRDWLTWVLLLAMVGLFVLFWLVADSVALRYFVLFIGVMNCLYSVWDICDDLIFRKVNESDATAFSKVVGCCPPQVWGVIWLFISLGFFAAGIVIGIVAFKTPIAEQQADNFLDVNLKRSLAGLL
ncbi:uncharacterized protein PFL1_05493 [Pseudozyma flocculosa PF-1]|uniref:Peptidase M50B-like-domain-containing protein n=2 Tax=Pseudozyma flocculosa TaxID=84751 RepID=A0A5C3FC92_9BASI|nr:uncharacterized protein PFL1_05493 [Pseudozyma flocculosa PF-1]EPQ26858.1 hypothetical protein PFL1_05493 [Pseudozyma flocculosa PF-1]SPO41237.1 uncharacterized protein PSFLO_06719 [Pseudozyma flocculosa]